MHTVSRRTLLMTATGVIAAACSPAAPASTPAPTAKPAAAPSTAAPAAAVASPLASPVASPAAASGTAVSGAALRLVPLKNTELGAPPVPAPAVSTSATAVPHDAAVAAYDPFGTDAAPGVFPRTIRHATGTTTLAKKPERVLPIDSGELDAVVQLGLKPAGYLDHDVSLMPAHLVEALRGVKTVGTLAEPNLEAIAAIAPELVLTTKVRHEKIADRLMALAPTVFGISTGVVWKQNFALYAKSMGREIEGAAAVAAYEERVRKMNALLPNPRPRVSVIRVLANNLRYYQRANYSGTILNDLGFQRPPSQNVDDFALLNQSLETLAPLGDADLIVVCPTEGPNGNFMKEVMASSLWQNMNAVKNGAVIQALDDVWMAGIGYRSANLIMDDIARHFKIQA